MADENNQDLPSWGNSADLPTWDSTVPVNQQTLPQGYEPTALGAAGRGLAQGISAGWSDKALAALEAGGEKLGGSNKDLIDLYRQYRDIEQAKNKASEEAYPVTYKGSEIVGGLGQMAIPGLGELGLGKMAALGAASGLGYGKSDLTKGEIGQATKEALEGAGGGIAGYGLGEAIQPYIGKVASSLTKSADTSMKNASDAAMRVYGAGSETTAQELAPALNENIPSGAIPGRAGVGEKALGDLGVLDSNENRAVNYGKKALALEDQKQNIYNSVKNGIDDKIAQNGGQMPSELLSTDYLQGINQNIAPYMERLQNGITGGADKAQGLIDQIKQKIAEKGTDINALDDLKKQWNMNLKDAFDSRNSANDLSMLENIYKAGVQGINDRINQLADYANPGLGNQIRQINKDQSQYIPLAMDAATKLIGNVSRGNTAYGGMFASLGAIGGFKLGGPIGAAVGGGAGAASKALGESMLGQGIGDLTTAAGAKIAQGSAESKYWLAQKAAQLGQNAGLPISQGINAEAIPATEQDKNPPIAQQSSSNPVTNYAQDPEKTVQMNRAESGQNNPMLRTTSDVYSQTPEELGQLAQEIQKNPGLAHYGQYLQQAVQDGNQQKQDAALFALSQQKAFRDIINKRHGFENGR